MQHLNKLRITIFIILFLSVFLSPYGSMQNQTSANVNAQIKLPVFNPTMISNFGSFEKLIEELGQWAIDSAIHTIHGYWSSTNMLSVYASTTTSFVNGNSFNSNATVGFGAWSNPGNAQVLDSSYATATLGTTTTAYANGATWNTNAPGQSWSVPDNAQTNNSRYATSTYTPAGPTAYQIAGIGANDASAGNIAWNNPQYAVTQDNNFADTGATYGSRTFGSASANDASVGNTPWSGIGNVFTTNQIYATVSGSGSITTNGDTTSSVCVPGDNPPVSPASDWTSPISLSDGTITNLGINVKYGVGFAVLGIYTSTYSGGGTHFSGLIVSTPSEYISAGWHDFAVTNTVVTAGTYYYGISVEGGDAFCTFQLYADTSTGSWVLDSTGYGLPDPSAGMNGPAPVVNTRVTMQPVISEYLTVTGYGFSIPTGAIIENVNVYITRHSSCYACVIDNSVKIVKGGTVQGDNQASAGTPWSVADGTPAYGSPSPVGKYTWGLTLTPSDVNASNFGVALSVGFTSQSTAYVDSIELQIIYSYSTSQYLTVTNFGGFSSIPDAATIIGVQVEIYRVAFIGPTGGITDNTVKLVKNCSITGTNHASGSAWPDGFSGPAFAFYGSTSDAWGVSLTGADVKSSCFGAALSVNTDVPNNAYVDTIEIALTYANEISEVLTGLNFSSYSIPTTAEVLGIQVQIKRHASAASGTNDNTVQLLVSNSPVGSNKALATVWGISDASIIYGSVNDTWSLSNLHGSDVNDSQFGVELITNIGVNIASVDWISIAITYTTSPSQYLEALNFNSLSVPSTAAVNGIQVQVTKNASGGNFGITTAGSSSYPSVESRLYSTQLYNSASLTMFSNNFTPSVAMTVTQLETDWQTAGSVTSHFMMGIYDDSGGKPHALLGSVQGTVTTTGWIVLTLGTPLYLTAGVQYWMSMENQSASNRFYFQAGAANSECQQTHTYDGTLPNPSGACTLENSAINVGYFYVQIKGYTKGTRIQYTGVTCTNCVTSFSFDVLTYTAGDKAILILYNDSSGNPNHRLWYSDVSGTDLGGTGWKSINESSGTVDNSWNAGLTQNAYYWFMWQWNSVDAGPGYVSGAANSGIYLAQAFGTLLSTWSGGTLASANWSEYLTVSTITDLYVYLVNHGVVSGTNHVNASVWPTTDSTITYGTTSDNWGLNLVGSDVDATDFGVVVSATGNGTANVDWIGIAITYTTGTAFTQEVTGALTVSGTATRQVSGARFNPGSLTLTDALNRLEAVSKTIQHGSVLTASKNAVVSLTKSIQQPISNAIGLVRSVTNNRYNPVSIVITGTLGGSVTGLQRILNGGMNASGILINVKTFARTISQSLTINTFSIEEEIRFTLNAALSSIGNLKSLVTNTRFNSAGIVVTNSIDRLVFAVRNIPESLSALTGLSNLKSYVRNLISEVITLPTNVSRSITNVRYNTATNTVTDGLNRIVSNVRMLIENIFSNISLLMGGISTTVIIKTAITNAANVSVNLSSQRTGSVASAVTDGVARVANLQRIRRDVFILTANLVQEVLTVTKTIVQGINIVSNLQRIVTDVTKINQSSLVLSSSISLLTSNIRRALANITQNSSLSKDVVNLFKTISNGISIASNLQRIVTDVTKVNQSSIVFDSTRNAVANIIRVVTGSIIQSGALLRDVLKLSKIISNNMSSIASTVRNVVQSRFNIDSITLTLVLSHGATTISRFTSQNISSAVNIIRNVTLQKINASTFTFNSNFKRVVSSSRIISNVLVSGLIFVTSLFKYPVSFTEYIRSTIVIAGNRVRNIAPIRVIYQEMKFNSNMIQGISHTVFNVVQGINLNNPVAGTGVRRVVGSLRAFGVAPGTFGVAVTNLFMHYTYAPRVAIARMRINAVMSGLFHGQIYAQVNDIINPSLIPYVFEFVAIVIAAAGIIYMVAKWRKR